MLKTILIFCLLAFSTAQAATLTFGHAGADHLSLKGAVNAASTGDVLLCIASYSDTMTVGAVPGVLSELTIDFGGYTATFDLSTSSDHVIDADNVADFTVQNGTMILNNCLGTELRGSGYMLLDGITQRVRGVVSGTYTLGQTRSDTDSIRIEDSEFVYETLAGVAVNYPGHGNYGINIAHDIPLRAINSTFSGGKGWIFVNKSGGIQNGEIEISGCTFKKGYYHNVWVDYGGTVSVENSTFEADSVMSSAALLIETPASIAHDITISGNTFDDCMLYVGMNNDDAAQGGASGASAVVSGCTFTGDNISTQCVVRTNYAQITGNTFAGAGGDNFGGTEGSPHMLILGMDGSYDVRDNAAAENIRVYDNTFSPTADPASGVATYLCIVGKTGSFHVYDNLFDMTGVTLPASVTRAKTISLRGADSCYVYQNTFILDDETYGVIDLSSQPDNSPCLAVTFQDNRILGTYGSAISTTNWSSWNDYQLEEAVIGSNYYADDIDYIITNDGVTPVSTVDAADSTDWFLATNFEVTNTYQYSFGGAGGLTYTQSTPSGFVQPSHNPRTTDPVISKNEPGFETPVEAFLRCRDLGLTGVELDWYIHGNGAADALNMDNWLNGSGATGDGTASGSTWEAQAFDTLRVGKVK